MKSILLTCPSSMEADSMKDLAFHSACTVDIRTTGVGCIHTLYSLCSMNLKNYDWVLQCGIAGRMDKSISIGSTYIITQDTWGDHGVWENHQFRTIHHLGWVDKNQYPYTHGLLTNPHMAKINHMETASGVTVQQITTSRETIHYFKEQGFLVESMEGASLHFVALMQGVPFLQIRSISNDVGERDKTRWDIASAIQSLRITTKQIIHQLCSN